MNKILIVHTSWYEEYIKTMIDSATNILTTKLKLLTDTESTNE